MAQADELFPSERRIGEGGASTLFVSITCRKCHRVDTQPMKGPMLGTKVFRARGWLIGSKRNRDVCPGCRNQSDRRENMSGPAKRAAYNAIEERLDRQEAGQLGIAPPEPRPPVNTVMAEALAPLAAAMKAERRKPAPKGTTTGFTAAHNAARAARRHLGMHKDDAIPGVHYKIINEPGGTFGFELIPIPQETTMADPTQSVAGKAVAPPLVPAAPRQPTPPENRRVLDAMDAHYDADRQMYRGSFTDDSVSQQLKVPRAWVTKVRTEFYGPETNEAALMRGAKLDDAIKLAEAASAKLLDMAQQAETLADLKRAREAL